MATKIKSEAKNNVDINHSCENKFDCDTFYMGLTRRVSDSGIELYFGEHTHISKKDDAIYVDGMDKYYVRKIQDEYDLEIRESLKDCGINGDVMYGINPRLNDSQQLSLNFARHSKTHKKNKDIAESCYKYGHLENPFWNKPKVILHGGNRGIYRELDNILESLKLDNNAWDPFVLHGDNGLGKTYALNYLLYKAKNERIPAVAYNIGSLVNYLNPNNGNGFNKFGIPEWYTLAKDYAKLVVLDQLHDLIGKTKSGFCHRSGTQKWIFNLTESVKQRGGNVIFSFTDTKKLGLETLIDLLRDENEDRYGNIGNRDLGDRLESYFSMEVKHIPADDYLSVVKKIAGGNDELISDGMLSKNIIKAFISADYGTKSTFRRLVSNVNKVVRAAGAYDEEITPEFIIKVVGSKKAKDKFATNGFDFSEEPDAKSSFLDYYPIDNVAEAFMLFRIGEKIRVEGKDDEVLKNIFEEWKIRGDDIFTLNEDDSIVRYRALRKLMDKYKFLKNRLF